MTVKPDTFAAAQDSKQSTAYSVPAKLAIIVAMLVSGAALGLFGAAQINKSATLHRLNFLHLKYNHAFFEHVTHADNHGDIRQQLIEDLVLIRAQPIACIEVMGALERALLSVLGTSRALELCINDVALADQTLSSIEAYGRGIVDDKQLASALTQASTGFLKNSEEFEPLVAKTARFVYKSVFYVLLASSLITIFFATLLIKSVRAITSR